MKYFTRKLFITRKLFVYNDTLGTDKKIKPGGGGRQ